MHIFQKIKYSLVFFCVLLGIACEREGKVHIDQIDYEREKAVGVTFRTEMDVEQLRIFIGEESQQSVIGVIVSEDTQHHFTPVIPFTPGEAYTVRMADTLVMASFRIPERAVVPPNEILAIYPKVDTVPENLLKMYIAFKEPMQEVGNALDFIQVINVTDSTEVQPFLRLESELWNSNHTVLTVWLDPGRIKTDLIPNREKGLPLTAGKRYRMTIDSTWRSREGEPLQQRYTKHFDIGPRDDRKPDMRDWQLRIQKEDSTKSLYFDFKEPMDAYLALETIQLLDMDDRPINGHFKRTDRESVVRFVPDEEWQSPEIKIRVQSRLEDLAGNNLNRLFDTRIAETKKQKQDTGAIRTMRVRIQ